MGEAGEGSGSVHSWGKYDQGTGSPADISQPLSAALLVPHRDLPSLLPGSLIAVWRVDNDPINTNLPQSTIKQLRSTESNPRVINIFCTVNVPFNFGIKIITWFLVRTDGYHSSWTKRRPTQLLFRHTISAWVISPFDANIAEYKSIGER